MLLSPQPCGGPHMVFVTDHDDRSAFTPRLTYTWGRAFLCRPLHIQSLVPEAAHCGLGWHCVTILSGWTSGNCHPSLSLDWSCGSFVLHRCGLGLPLVDSLGMLTSHRFRFCVDSASIWGDLSEGDFPPTPLYLSAQYIIVPLLTAPLRGF